MIRKRTMVKFKLQLTRQDVGFVPRQQMHRAA